MTVSSRVSPLFTDLYELTMGAAYLQHQRTAPATFSLFLRDNHPQRNYFVAAGIGEAVEALADLKFSPEEIDYLRETGLFPEEFLSCLGSFRFTGDVRALPEGTVFFPNEPILEVTAPIIQAQLLETFLLNTIGLQTMLASKAARCVHAAGGRPVIDFSLRRTQGLDAGLAMARVSYLTGFTGTSNVLAGQRYGIPVSGTMAHSYVTAFDREIDAFRAYGRSFPNKSVFLIDTYDVETGARNAAIVGKEMKAAGHPLVGVRIDSGDMGKTSQVVRRILDEEGCPEVKIFVSSDFDEFKIRRVLSQGARIDAFGVGTKVGVSADAPYLVIVYKMTRYGDREVRKLSPGKVNLAGEKQVFRRISEDGRYVEDIIGTRDEAIPDTRPLLQPVMAGGRSLLSPQPLAEIRERFAGNLTRLDEVYKSLDPAPPFPVRISPRLDALQRGGCA